MDRMDDLVQFLRARLDEDAAIAKRVESRWRQIGETGVIVASDGTHAEECANGNWTGIADHIARHDPARVLAEVDAKRRMVDVHGPRKLYPDADSLLQRTLIVCRSCGPSQFPKRPASHHMYPCPTLRLLALPYVDNHPDYRDTWRP